MFDVESPREEDVGADQKWKVGTDYSTIVVRPWLREFLKASTRSRPIGSFREVRERRQKILSLIIRVLNKIELPDKIESTNVTERTGLYV